MKIAVIRQKYVNYGGAENFAADFSVQLAQSGHEVHVFANQWNAPGISNIEFHKVPAIKLNAFFRTLSFAWFAANRLRGKTFDVIQSHEKTWHQDVYRAGDGCHRAWLERRNQYASPLRRLLVNLNPYHRLILRLEKLIFAPSGCKKVVAISQMVKDDIQRYYKVPDSRIEVIYNGVRLDKFHPGNRESFGLEIRKRHGIDDGELLFLFIGSGFERKGLRYLLESLKYLQHDNWKLMVIGKCSWDRYKNFASTDLL